ncbi:helix-turn-helix transcriptional regulator [Streptomyces sp. HP-A2021]|uniref:helix-turn-helix transcriptional regulator n=1 Tax=Streptomyces sp. HP-A2021 TaxID=2927875 RepID=UPI001FAF6751|nr:helix-turn-helix transcriptional regulator [Streptomyces sp. HP-A2021]UOB15408.1 helix-turn-helix transcriptional regulator [Streptomyces sp. HP-A2021]
MQLQQHADAPSRLAAQRSWQVQTMTSNPLEPWGIDHAALAVYEAVLARPDRHPAELASELDLSLARTGAALELLTDLGLVHGEEGRVRAGRPSTAMFRLVRDQLRQAADQAAGTTALLNALERFTSLDAAGGGSGSPLVTVRDVSDHWQRCSATAAAHAHVESLSVNPHPGTFELLTPDYVARFAELLRAGTVTLRCIVSPHLPEMPGVRAAMDVLAEAGGKFRSAPGLPSWFHILGPHHAGIPFIWGQDPSADGMAHHLVQAPPLVSVLRALFEELWRRAVPTTAQPAAARDQRTVLRLLAQGLSDEAVARHMGISVRTVRQRVAGAMEELGVRTRFAAAATAARNGWFT